METTRLRDAANELAVGQEKRISKTSLVSLLMSIADWQESRARLDQKNFENDVVIDAHLLAKSILGE